VPRPHHALKNVGRWPRAFQVSKLRDIAARRRVKSVDLLNESIVFT
jgi:hypothetical protein